MAGSVIKESYYSPDFLRREYEKLWPHVWQSVCREEELVEAGDYVTYEIGDESIMVTRLPAGELRAWHNVCQHRGRRLLTGCGNVDTIRCPFHGWRWDLEGKNTHVTFEEDWEGSLEGEDLGLSAVRLDTWGGFVFITLDPDAEPLLDYLGEAAEALAPFELHRMRYRWRKWLKIPANWKIALEAFNEGYHVSITHWPLNQYGTSRFVSRGVGRHGTFATDGSRLRPESGSSDRPQPPMPDVDTLAKTMAGFFSFLKANIDSNMSDSMVHAAQMLPVTLPAGATAADVMPTIMQTAKEIDAARGVQWPDITPEQYQRGGVDWHLFPNTVLLPMATNCLCYRSRPDGDNPDWCIFEVAQIERLPEDELKKVGNPRNDDLTDTEFWGSILLQDFEQMADTHRGMKSTGYRGPRLNPRQEASIANFHRVYHEYLDA